MFSNKIVIPVGSEGKLILRKPDAREIKNFHQKAYGTKDANDVEARCNFFDELFLSVEKCKDDEGDIPTDGKARIPDLSKNAVILRHVENLDAHDPKNW